jgi:DNA topoisomerase-3
MLHLVGHFGDREDSGAACGHCDICAPDKCAAATFRSVRGDDLRILAGILHALDESDGQGTGRLCKLCVGETPDDRRKFDALLGSLVRAGFVRVTPDSFEKDGKRINFTRANLTDLGKGDRDLSDLVITNVESSSRSSKKSKRGKGRAGRAPERARGPISASLVEALKGWRLQESRRRKIPAFRILTDRVLSALAEHRPSSEAELLQISGIGPKIAEQYGAKLIAICRE